MKANVAVTYTATIDIGDVPTQVVQGWLEKNDSDYNIFDFDPEVSDVEVASA